MKRRNKRLSMVEPTPANKRRSGGRPVSRRTEAGTSSAAALPGWTALSDISKGRSRRKKAGFLDRITTSRFVLWLVGLGAAGTLYVGHVHATQQTFENLHALRKENLRLHLERDRLQGVLDHALGPTRIYPKAHALGLREGFSYGPTLKLRTK